MDWTSDELHRIGTAQELAIAPLRRDGSLRTAVPIWVVRYAGGLYVRSWRGPRAAWFRGVHDRCQGRIQAGGIDKDVMFVDIEDEGVKNAVDVAYRAKYGTSGYVADMVTEPARSTTIKLVPR